MEVINLIEAIKDDRGEVFREMVSEEGVRKSLSSLSEIIGCRAYFTIDGEGNIGRKPMNYALPLGAFSRNQEKLGDMFFELANPVERVKHKKIERLSREDLGKLNKNFFKIVAGGNVDFAKRYAKELYMRDREGFFKKLFHYTLMEEIDSQKALMALALKELIWDEYDDNIMNAGMTYLAAVRSDFHVYEEVKGESGTSKEEVLAAAEDLRAGKSKEELNLLAYLRVLGEYTYTNEGKFIEIAQKRLEEISQGRWKKTEANYYENEIIKGL